AGPDTITFGVTGTIVLTTGAIQITDALTIQGPGAPLLSIDGNASNRVFTIVEVASPACPALTGPADFLVTMSGMTIRNGSRNVANSGGGGIFTAKSLVLQNVVVRDNRAKSGAGVSFSAQYPNQSLTVTGSSFINNVAEETVAGNTGSINGGAITIGERCTSRTLPVTVAISDSLFSGNEVRPTALNGRGGAVAFFSDSDITITRSRVVDNRVVAPGAPPGGTSFIGGGIYGRARSFALVDSEVTGNSAETGGAMGFYNDVDVLQAPADAMEATVVNSTVSNNAAGTSVAIYGFGNVAIELANATVVRNTAQPGRTGGVGFNTGPTSPPTASNAAPGTLKLASTVLWNPGDASGLVDIAKNNANIPGALAVAATDSIVGTLCLPASCGTITLNGTGNQVGVDPLLGPLSAFNGGPTRTRLPQNGSPAVDRGANALALATDQRGAGFPRTLGAATDVGAVEYAFPALCRNFNDVPGNSAFCPSVEWIRNRNVTTGCGSGNYCPAADVSRLAMAAFMKRLGDALSGTSLITNAQPGLLDFTGGPVVCLSSPVVAQIAPRRAILDGAFSGRAGADSGGRLRVVVSEDNGVTWRELQAIYTRSTFPANQWHSVRSAYSHDLEAGKAVVYGLRIDPGSAAPAGVLDSTCVLRVRLENSSGFTPL
ncbi:MAG TPA: choice-of-anchor Q domain-containing protein, partial [Casimicrobiaceae bacterium]|nr:choice-of-anchor Q domain-containing protein [Casimicrobiaceae bacterium]